MLILKTRPRAPSPRTKHRVRRQLFDVLVPQGSRATLSADGQQGMSGLHVDGPFITPTIAELVRFRAKWIPVRVKKTRQTIKLELRF